jgi:hypothetical protein
MLVQAGYLPAFCSHNAIAHASPNRTSALVSPWRRQSATNASQVCGWLRERMSC